MNINKIIIQSLVLIILCVSPALTQDKPTSVGNIENVTKAQNIYYNKYFKFSINIIEGWEEVSNDDSSKLLDFAQKTDTKINDKAKEILEQSIKDTQLLYHYSKNPIGYRDNSLFIIAAEYLGDTDIDFKFTVHASQENLEKNMGHEIIKGAHIVKVGGKDFYLIEMKKTLYGITVFQNLYMQKFGQFVLQIVYSYTTVKDLKIMDDNLKTLKFDK